MRQCGECEVCCTVCEVPELSKPVDVKCGHCNGGCTIYQARPSSCRTFNCYWLAHPEVSESLRPDKCGVMVESITPEMLVAYASSKDWNSAENMEYLQSLSKGGRSVVLKSGDDRHFFVPEGRTAKEVWNDLLQEATKRGV